MLVILALYVVLVTVICSALLWRNRALNPMFLFVVFSGVSSMGAIANLDAWVESDVAHVYLIILFFTSIFLHVVFFHSRKRDSMITAAWNAKRYAPAGKEKFGNLLFIYIFSAAVIIYYFEVLVGYNLFAGAVFGGIGDFTSLRLASYSGAIYTGAGVVNQFKNTIFPIAFFVLAVSLFYRLQFIIYWIIAAPASIFYLWSILGTGQRTHFFFSMLCLLFYFFNVGKLSIRVLVPTTTVFLVLFSLFSLSLGRTDNISVGKTLSQLGSRLFVENQVGTVAGMRYVYDIPIQNGSEWLKILVGYVPGLPGSDLTNRVHGYQFGSLRGTAPVALWVSIYHNFGFPGVPIVTLALMKLIEFSRLIIVRKPKSVFWSMYFSFLFFYIGIIPISDPFQIMNNGLLGLIALYFVYGVNLSTRTISFSLGPVR